MTRDDVIAMAREAGFTGSFDIFISEVLKFERLISIVEARAIAREREATDKLRAFAQDIFQDWPDCGELDGFDLQEMGAKHGLLVGTMKTAPCQEEGCNCAGCGDFPMMCFTKTPLINGDVQDKGGV